MSRVESVRRVCTPLRVSCALNAAIVGVFVWLAWPAVMAEPDPQYLEDIAAEMTALMAEGQEGLENAAPIYEEAIAELERLNNKWKQQDPNHDWDGRIRLLTRRQWGSEEHEAALVALEDGDKLFALLEQAAEVDGFTVRFKIQTSASQYRHLTHPALKHTYDLAGSLQARLRVACLSGDWTNALVTISLITTAAQHYARTPGVWVQQMSFSYSHKVRELIYLTQELQLPTPFCEQAIVLLEQDLLHQIDIERYVDGMAFDFRWLTSDGFDHRGRMLTSWLGAQNEDWHYQLFSNDEFIPNLAERLRDVTEIFGVRTHDEFMRTLDKVKIKLRLWTESPSSKRPKLKDEDWTHSLDKFGVERMYMYGINLVDQRHHYHYAAITLLRLEIFYSKHSVWPESLDELPGGAPIDPRYGKPFLYERIEDDEHDRPYLLFWPNSTAPNRTPINEPRR